METYQEVLFMKFGEKIKETRIKLGYSQQEVADALYVTRQTVSKWELSKSYPDLELLIALSDLYELSLDSLLKEDVQFMEFLKSNPQATKPQKISALITSMTGCLAFVAMAACTMIRFYSKMSALMMSMMFVCGMFFFAMFMLFAGHFFKVLTKKENAATREKKTASPVHSWQNRSNVMTFLLMLSFIGYFVCAFTHHALLMWVFFALEMSMFALDTVYSKKIKDKLSTHEKIDKKVVKNTAVLLGLLGLLILILTPLFGMLKR